MPVSILRHEVRTVRSMIGYVFLFYAASYFPFFLHSVSTHFFIPFSQAPDQPLPKTVNRLDYIMVNKIKPTRAAGVWCALLGRDSTNAQTRKVSKLQLTRASSTILTNIIKATRGHKINQGLIDALQQQQENISVHNLTYRTPYDTLHKI
jgi:hypothetical protein